MADGILDLINLTQLMELTSGRPEIVIGLVDGPVVIGHPDLAGENVREIGGRIGGTCDRASSLACMHGTFVAGILSAKRSSAAPAICPGCTLLVRPIFPETISANELIPSATPEALAKAIIECIDAGARLVNLSAALAQPPSAKGERALAEALDFAATRGVIVVAAAGNQGTVGSTLITRHPAVIAVIACDRRGRPLDLSNIGSSIGRRGLSAPGEGVTSLITLRLHPAPSLPVRASAVIKPETLTEQHPTDRGATTHVPSHENNRPAGSLAPQQLTPAPCPTCAGASAFEARSFVYALGRIGPRFPSLAVEKEFAQVAYRADDTKGLTDRQTAHSILSNRENRYLARQVCWVLSIEGLETYILVPRDPVHFDLLTEAMRPAPSPTDMDVVIGVRAPIAPLEICAGLMIPIRETIPRTRLPRQGLSSWEVDSPQG